MPEFEITKEDEGRRGTTDQQARDPDVERKRTVDSDESEGDKVLLINEAETEHDVDNT